MKTTSILFKSIISLALLVSPAMADPGLVVKSETQELKKNETTRTTLFMDQNSIKVVDGNQEVIFDSGKESFTIIDHNKKEAIIITKAEMETLKQQLKMMMDMMEQQLKNLPPEQQEMVKKNMNGYMPSDGDKLNYEYRLIKSGVVVQQWKSSQYEGLINGEKKGELFIAEYGELGYSKSDFVALEKMAEFMHDMLADFGDKIDFGGSGSGFFGFGGKDNPVFTKGIPVKMIEFSKEGVQERIITIKDIGRQDLDAATFTVPGDYRKSTLQEQMKGMFGR